MTNKNGISFDRIETFHWIDPDHREKVRNKQKHFDRVILITDGESITLDGLGQAVFPLMKVLEWIIKGRTKHLT